MTRQLIQRHNNDRAIDRSSLEQHDIPAAAWETPEIPVIELLIAQCELIQYSHNTPIAVLSRRITNIVSLIRAARERSRLTASPEQNDTAQQQVGYRSR